MAGNRGHLWGEQHRIETRTKRNHWWVNSGCVTIGGNYSRSPVVFTLDNAAKGKAGIQFIAPGTEEAKGIKNVLLKYKIADEEYPYKPMRVAQLVTETTGKRFLISNNTQAWHLYKVRPPKGSKQPQNTNRDFCIYHAAHKDYTYSEKWVVFLCEKVSSEDEFKKIKAVQVH